MSKKLVVDVPEDLRKRFKTLCAKNGTTIHDEINGFMSKAVEGAEEDEKKEAAPPEEKVREEGDPSLKNHIDNTADNSIPPFLREKGKPSLENQDDFPFFDTDVAKDDAISQKIADGLKPICEKLESQQTIRQSEIDSLVSWRDDVRKWLKDWRAEVDLKFAVVAKFLENHIDVLEKNTFAERCEDDIKGLKLLRGESN